MTRKNSKNMKSKLSFENNISNLKEGTASILEALKYVFHDNLQD